MDQRISGAEGGAHRGQRGGCGRVRPRAGPGADGAGVPDAAQGGGIRSLRQPGAGGPADHHCRHHRPGDHRVGGGTLCGRRGGHAGGAACQRGDQGAEEHQSQHSKGHQSVFELSGQLGGQYYDRRGHRSEKIHDGGPGHRPDTGPQRGQRVHLHLLCHR